MLDIGWSELLLIGIVALIVVGPKELPGLFRTVGQFTGRARAMAREFQRSLEQAAEQSGLNEAADGLKAVDRVNLKSAFGNIASASGTASAKPAPPASGEVSRFDDLQPDPAAPEPAADVDGGGKSAPATQGDAPGANSTAP